MAADFWRVSAIASLPLREGLGEWDLTARFPACFSKSGLNRFNSFVLFSGSNSASSLLLCNKHISGSRAAGLGMIFLADDGWRGYGN
jgi:hypothetical protein